MVVEQLIRDRQLIAAASRCLRNGPHNQWRALRRMIARRSKFPFPQLSYYLAIGTVPRGLWE
jgi:hypothetical protein